MSSDKKQANVASAAAVVIRRVWDKAIQTVCDERPSDMAEHHVRSIVCSLEAARDEDLVRFKKRKNG